MKTKFFFTCTAFIASLTLSAQSVEREIDNAIKHPQAKENAAKADVYILEKKIFDSTTIKTRVTQQATKAKKKSGCKKGTKIYK